jgi:hypothetical protein
LALAVLPGAFAFHGQIVIRDLTATRVNSVLPGVFATRARVFRSNRNSCEMASAGRLFPFSATARLNENFQRQSECKPTFAQNTTRQDFRWQLLKKYEYT